MHGGGKSDRPVVPGKPLNNAGVPAAEVVEGRGLGKGNVASETRPGPRAGQGAPHGLDRVRRAARRDKEARFTALLHHVDPDRLKAAYRAINPDAATGVDGVTWQAYGQDLEANLRDLLDRVHGGSYRASPSRRAYIPKPDGRQRPLGISVLEDKIVQRAVVEVLNAIYEQDFLGFSYGFRPGRGAHDAMDALVVGIERRKVNFIVDADIRAFFDTVDQQWLIRFVEHRIGDRRIIRLIRKWLKAGVLEEGAVRVSEQGTAQGAVISPLLANIYLHYALDLWAERYRRREVTGDMIIVRYADDFIVGFEHEGEARRFLEALRERLKEFALSLHPEKTRLIEFGRDAEDNRRRRGLGKPETFHFLGFTFICGRSRQGKFQIRRKSRRDRMRAKLQAVKQELQRRMHQALREQGRWLRQVVTGYFNYHAVPTNSRALSAFRFFVTELWRRTLRRRCQIDGTTWRQIARIAQAWLPKPQILHRWPQARFAVTHPRWEPYAGKPHVRIYAGCALQAR
jgi:RNA-directed DNA polymerase